MQEFKEFFDSYKNTGLIDGEIWDESLEQKQKYFDQMLGYVLERVERELKLLRPTK